MTPSGIEPATFRFVAQYLKHCATISGPLSDLRECPKHNAAENNGFEGISKFFGLYRSDNLYAPNLTPKQEKT
jgi:hypothetical protein